MSWKRTWCAKCDGTGALFVRRWRCLVTMICRACKGRGWYDDDEYTRDEPS